MNKQNKQSALIHIIPCIGSIIATLIVGASMALVDRLWDRPGWIDWIPPGAIFAIMGGLTAGIVFIGIMAALKINEINNLTYPAFVLVASCGPMMLVWNVYSCNGFNWVSGPLTLAGFIVMGFIGMLLPYFYSRIKRLMAGERIFTK